MFNYSVLTFEIVEATFDNNFQKLYVDDVGCCDNDVQKW